jgi:hypothetical protein
MKMTMVLLLVCTLLGLLTQAVGAEDATPPGVEHPPLGDNYNDGGQEITPRCSIYLAKSTIPNAGWGVFAARDFQMGVQIVSQEEEYRGRKKQFSVRLCG